MQKTEKEQPITITEKPELQTKVCVNVQRV